MDHNQCQFLFLQEHWLSDTQINDLVILNANYLSTGVHNRDVLSDRPFGGCTILWQRDIRAKVSIVAIVSWHTILYFTCVLTILSCC